MLCYDYYVLLFGMIIIQGSPLPLWILFVSLLVLVPGFDFWCYGKSQRLYMAVCLFVRNFSLSLVGIVSLLFCPLLIFKVFGTEACSSPCMDYIVHRYLPCLWKKHWFQAQEEQST
jgi:hypothetical protein